MSAAPLMILMLLPLSGLGLLLVRTDTLRLRLSLAAQGAALLLALTTALRVRAGGPYVLTAGPYEAPWGITLNIGAAEAFFATLFLAIALALTAYGLPRLHQEMPAEKAAVYPSLFHMSLAAVLGALLTGDLFNGFVFMEVSGLSACGMILLSRNEDAPLSALKYLVLGSLGSGLFLMGIAYLYAVTGHLNLHHIGTALRAATSGYPAVVTITLALFLTGLGLKSAIFPLHLWLPDAYDASPTPVTAFFSALSGKAPAILLMKLLFGVYGGGFLAGTSVGSILMTLGAAGMIAGSLLALRQTQLKRMLAYSSVAQMGYIFLGIGLGSPLGAALALYHMAAHSLSKACLFLTAGALQAGAASLPLTGCRGLGRTRPLTLGLFTAAALSMVGIPIFPGFISKFNLSLAALEAGFPVLLAVILLSSLLNAAYYFPVIIQGFFGAPAPAGPQEPDTLADSAPALAMALLLVAVGLFSGPLLAVLSHGFYAGA